jgi:hypothetical protein
MLKLVSDRPKPFVIRARFGVVWHSIVSGLAGAFLEAFPPPAPDPVTPGPSPVSAKNALYEGALLSIDTDARARERA